MAHEATSMNNIHKLSWMAGQWYLCRRSTRRVSYTTELSVTVEAIMFFFPLGSRPRVWSPQPVFFKLVLISEYSGVVGAAQRARSGVEEEEEEEDVGQEKLRTLLSRGGGRGVGCMRTIDRGRSRRV